VFQFACAASKGAPHFARGCLVAHPLNHGQNYALALAIRFDQAPGFLLLLQAQKFPALHYASAQRLFGFNGKDP
jgi:hypothetical protein